MQSCSSHIVIAQCQSIQLRCTEATSVEYGQHKYILSILYFQEHCHNTSIGETSDLDPTNTTIPPLAGSTRKQEKGFHKTVTCTPEEFKHEQSY